MTESYMGSYEPDTQEFISLNGQTYSFTEKKIGQTSSFREMIHIHNLFYIS